MRIYNIAVTETYHKEIKIPAPNLETALKEIRKAYKNKEITLTQKDFYDVDIYQG